MEKILVVVESPNKISKILSFLGSKYKVEASYGIFRDLDKNKMSINFDKNFEPQYIITKPDVVKKLKKAMQGVNMLYIASDLDYEGENIAQSIYDILKPKEYKRLIFNAITRDAILTAIKTAGKIDNRKVDAQKTRRVLDRLYGYLISPILQQKLGRGLSAGRVQSVASRIVIDKENEIKDFIEKNNNSSVYKTTGTFSTMRASLYKLSDKLGNSFTSKSKFVGSVCNLEPDNNVSNKSVNTLPVNIENFLNKCIMSDFYIHHVEKRNSSRSPSPPFTTSTLQQEANRKLGMSLETTMSVAQKLYEAGYITYMRTDSVEISPEGHRDIKIVIVDKYGKEYYNKNVYTTKSTSSQEAHEAIRPVHPELLTIKNEIEDPFQIRLYNLIWQRTIASQMANAILEITSIQISISEYITAKKNPLYYFQAINERIVFKGFMEIYVESQDDNNETCNNDTNNTDVKVGQKLIMMNITCRQEYMRPPIRYTPASLVKKLEELGIGRPSTYVNTLKVIMDRNYVTIGDIVGTKKKSMEYKIQQETNNKKIKIQQTSNDIMIGADKKKLLPTNVGINVNTFLMNHFLEIMKYDFTATVEQQMDEVASGKRIWYDVIQEFYDKLKPMIDKAKTTTTSKILGYDNDNNEISVTIAKYGPVVKKKLISNNSTRVKYVYAKIKEPYTIETITLKQALELLQYPKLIGTYKDRDILLQKGEQNYYIIYDHNNYSIETTTIDLDTAIKIIKLKEKKSLASYNIIDGKVSIHAVLLEGPYGIYIQATKNNKKENYPIPKNIQDKLINGTNLSDKEILEIIKTKKKPYVKRSKIGQFKKSTNLKISNKK